jgi:undecaprenyl-diphosphatase
MDTLTYLQSIILGVVQGLTEFLPVSSSGHLVLVPAILRWPAPGLLFDTLLHWGTLGAVAAYFFDDLIGVVRDWFASVFLRRPATPQSRLGWYLIVGSVPAAIIGYLGKSYIEQLFAEPAWVGGFLLVTAAALVASERRRRGDKDLAQMTVWDALLIGAAQGLAVAPGLSRSGATIAVGLFLGLRRPAAARFSFLLAVPVILGAGGFQLMELAGAGIGDVSWGSVLVGVLAALVSGYLCIRFLLRYLQRHSLYVFAGYCAVVGVAVLALSAAGWL